MDRIKDAELGSTSWEVASLGEMISSDAKSLHEASTRCPDKVSLTAQHKLVRICKSASKSRGRQEFSDKTGGPDEYTTIRLMFICPVDLFETADVYFI